jgi:hypothetical protein
VKRARLVGLVALVTGAIAATVTPMTSAPAAETSTIYASTTCAAATKPGRIRCRAVLELPLDRAKVERLSWAELVVLEAGAGVVPLRGRLGPLDAETVDDARFTWSFSVTAAQVGERTLKVALRGTLEAKDKSGAPTPVERIVVTTVRVAP